MCKLCLTERQTDQGRSPECCLKASLIHRAVPDRLGRISVTILSESSMQMGHSSLRSRFSNTSMVLIAVENLYMLKLLLTFDQAAAAQYCSQSSLPEHRLQFGPLFRLQVHRVTQSRALLPVRRFCGLPLRPIPLNPKPKALNPTLYIAIHRTSAIKKPETETLKPENQNPAVP